MQIILVQPEVEEAIKDYIGKRVTLAPNTDIQIDLAATRGAEGVKAIVDLVPMQAGTKGATTGPKKPAPVAITKPAAAAAPAPTAAELKAAVPEPAKTAEPSVEPAAEAPADASETAQDESAASAATDEPGDGSEEALEGTEAAAEPPATPPVRSLFANLRKPQNS